MFCHAAQARTPALTAHGPRTQRNGREKASQRSAPSVCTAPKRTADAVAAPPAPDTANPGRTPAQHCGGADADPCAERGSRPSGASSFHFRGGRSARFSHLGRGGGNPDLLRRCQRTRRRSVGVGAQVNAWSPKGHATREACFLKTECGKPHQYFQGFRTIPETWARSLK